MPPKKSVGRSGLTRRPGRSRRSQSEVGGYVQSSWCWPAAGLGAAMGSLSEDSYMGWEAARREEAGAGGHMRRPQTSCLDMAGSRRDGRPLPSGRLPPQVRLLQLPGEQARGNSVWGPGFLATQQCLSPLTEQVQGLMGPSPPAPGQLPPSSRDSLLRGAWAPAGGEPSGPSQCLCVGGS